MPVLPRDKMPYSGIVGAVAVLGSVAYFGYVLLVRFLQGNPLTIASLDSLGLFLFVWALSAGLLAIGWLSGARVSTLVSLGLFLFWPWVYIAIPIGNPGSSSIPFVAALVVISMEMGARYRSTIRQRVSRVGTRRVLGVGLWHLVVGLLLQRASQPFFRRLYVLPDDLLPTVIYMVSALALFCTGAAVVVLWSEEGLRTPVIFGSGWLLWGLYATWSIRQRLPLGESWGINWVGIPPGPNYMLKWAPLLFGLSITAGVELLVRRDLR